MTDTNNQKVGIYKFYASNNYNVEPHHEHSKSPLIYKDFPFEGYNLTIELGNIPEWLTKTRKISTAYNLQCFKAFKDVKDDDVETERKNLINLSNEITFEEEQKYKYFVTITLEWDIKIDEKLRNSSPVTRLSILKLEKIILCQQHLLDLAVLRLNSNEVYSRYLEVLLSEKSFVKFSDGLNLQIPKFIGGTATLSIGNSSEEIIDTTLLDNSIVPTSTELENYSEPLYWLVSALNEKDRYRKFLWSFFCIEKCVNKYFKYLYETDNAEDNTGISSHLIYDKDIRKIILEANIFKRLLIAIFPRKRIKKCGEFSFGEKLEHCYTNLFSDDDSELKTLNKLKKLRDGSSHGNYKIDLIDTNATPQAQNSEETLKFATKILNAVLDKIK